MIEEKIKFPETVFLIDVEYLNYVISDIKKHFTGILKRELPAIELDKFITYLALDAAITAGEKEIMVVLIHNQDTPGILHCIPSDIKNKLHNKAFKNQLGEFQFSGLSTEGITSNEELFLNVFELIVLSVDTKKIIVIGFDEIDRESLTEMMSKQTGKDLIQFGMQKPTQPLKHKWEFVAFPLMQALGIRGEEIS